MPLESMSVRAKSSKRCVVTSCFTHDPQECRKEFIERHLCARVPQGEAVLIHADASPSIFFDLESKPRAVIMNWPGRISAGAALGILFADHDRYF
jgi:hypothetical protein